MSKELGEFEKIDVVPNKTKKMFDYALTAPTGELERMIRDEEYKKELILAKFIPMFKEDLAELSRLQNRLEEIDKDIVHYKNILEQRGKK